MNYYEHHIGDYAEATAHLSLVEDAIYSRLLRKYYASESPLPADKRKLARLVGARSKDEMAALDLVLEDFFVLQDGEYHNARCDREIEEFRQGEPDRELRKVNERNRNNMHRAERSRLFKRLTDAGGHAAWNIPIAELRALVRSVAGPETATPATPEVVDFSIPATPPSTAPATPATATQTPDTITQTPIPKESSAPSGHQQHGGPPVGPAGPARAGFADPAGADPAASGLSPGPADAGPAQQAAQAMQATGLADVSASHPRLVALVAAGITAAELAEAARSAVKAGRGFPWALARAEGQRRDAASAAALPPAPPPGQPIDPDSRAAIEADGERLGLGRWKQLDAKGRTVPWSAYADRVRQARASQANHRSTEAA